MSIYASYIFCLIGAILILVSGLGLLKLPDVYCRAHAVTKALTFGISCILIAGMFAFQSTEVTIKLGVAIIFQFLTIPLGGHVLGLVAYKKGVARWKQQEIADHRKEQ